MCCALHKHGDAANFTAIIHKRIVSSAINKPEAILNNLPVLCHFPSQQSLRWMLLENHFTNKEARLRVREVSPGYQPTFKPNISYTTLIRTLM
jgi:hypothetical protein